MGQTMAFEPHSWHLRVESLLSIFLEHQTFDNYFGKKLKIPDSVWGTNKKVIRCEVKH